MTGFTFDKKWIAGLVLGFVLLVVLVVCAFAICDTRTLNNKRYFFILLF